MYRVGTQIRDGCLILRQNNEVAMYAGLSSRSTNDMTMHGNGRIHSYIWS